MPVDGDAARCDMRAGHIERCLASGMAIGEWCSLNKVNRSSLYRWLAVFRDEDPGGFDGKNPEAFGWMKAACEGVAAVKAIVPAAVDPAEEAPGSRGRRNGKPLGAFPIKTGKLREASRSTRLL